MLKLLSYFKPKFLLWLSVSMLFISLIFFYRVFLFENNQKISLPLANCDLKTGPCCVAFPSGELIYLRTIPTSMPVLTSIIIDVKIPKELYVNKMHVCFKGKEMNMGKFKYTLEAKEKNTYTAQTFLPTCIHREMIWQAVLNIDTKSITYEVPFILINERPSA